MHPVTPLVTAFYADKKRVQVTLKYGFCPLMPFSPFGVFWRVVVGPGHALHGPLGPQNDLQGPRFQAITRDSRTPSKSLGLRHERGIGPLTALSAQIVVKFRGVVQHDLARR